jgi:NTE family protein
MSSIGLVLGGGGVTGSAFEMATLMAIELATGWSPNRAATVIGTSAGAYVAALVRNEALRVDHLVQSEEDHADVAQRISGYLYENRRPGMSVRSWIRNGLVPGLRRPGLRLLLGSPAPWTASGLATMVRDHVGAAADSWPARPTVVVAYDITARRRVAFGTVDAPDVGLADAVAASSAIPVLFRPYRIGDHDYVDGGVVSGTHADLVLGSEVPLDLVLVLAPMAAGESREGAWLHERVLDRVGASALTGEIARIRAEWPACEVVVLRPGGQVLEVMRPNPMDPDGAVPTFIRTLAQMKAHLAEPELWSILDRHLVDSRVGWGTRTQG